MMVLLGKCGMQRLPPGRFAFSSPTKRCELENSIDQENIFIPKAWQALVDEGEKSTSIDRRFQMR